jgi:hypothetical protein
VAVAGPGTRVALAAALSLGLAAAAAGLPRDPKEELRKDLRDDAPVGDWIYDDIDAGFARALREKKPVCIVFR